MQIDDVVWQIINQTHCAFKIKTPDQNFCRNEYNVTGLCNRSSCPLANSNYATVIEKKGVCSLYIKTIERSHMPSKMWEIIKLDKNYKKALEQIDENLEFWPNFLIHKCKQRLTKLIQMLVRMRKLRLKGYKEFSEIKKKAERRDKIRRAKAEAAADIEGSIEQELLERLKAGTYGDIYNYNKKAFSKVMGEKEVVSEQESEKSEELEREEGYVFDNEGLLDDEDELENNFEGEFDDDDDDGLDEDDEDDDGDEEGYEEDKFKTKPEKGKKKEGEAPRGRKRVVVEYEEEKEQEREQGMKEYN